MTDLAFGTYDVFSPRPLTSTGRIRVSCPKGQGPLLTLSPGNSGTFVTRELRSASDILRYNVYLDPGLNTVWGDGTDGSAPLLAPSGSSQLVIYGLIPSGQDAAGGNYSDELVLTVFL